jgi:cytochrome P450
MLSMLLGLILKALGFIIAVYLLVAIVREIKSYTSLAYLKRQGIKTLYFPIAGFLWIVRPQKGVLDQLTELRKIIADFKDEKAFAINGNFETAPNIVLLDDELLREFFVKEIDHTEKYLHVANINKGFSLHNGQRAFEARGIYSKFFNNDNLVNLSARASRNIERAMQEHQLSEFKGADSCEVLSKQYITRCMCYMMNCVVLGEDEVSFDRKNDLSERVIAYNTGMFDISNSLKNVLTWGVLHKYNIFPESRALWNELQSIESEIYSRYLRRQATQPRPEPNIIDSLVEFNRAKREAGEPELDKKEIAGHWMLIQTAGVDTTMQLTIYGLYILAHDMKLQEKIRAAVDELVESKKGEPLTYSDYMENDVLDRFINELLRIGGPAAFLNPRRVLKEFTVGKLTIKPGATLLIPLGANMCTERFYNDPDTFYIDRMSKDSMKKVKRAGFMPFGQGRRICPGRVLAELMARILIIHTLRKYVVEPSPNSDDTIVFGVTYGFRNPRFVLRKR